MKLAGIVAGTKSLVRVKGIVLQLFLLGLLSLRVALSVFSKEDTTWLVVKCQIWSLTRVNHWQWLMWNQRIFSSSSSLTSLVHLCHNGLWRIHYIVWSWAGNDYLSWQHVLFSVAGIWVPWPQYWSSLSFQGFWYWWESHSIEYWGWCGSSLGNTTLGVVGSDDV